MPRHYVASSFFLFDRGIHSTYGFSFLHRYSFSFRYIRIETNPRQVIWDGRKRIENPRQGSLEIMSQLWGIKKMHVNTLHFLQEKQTCPENCPCDEPKNWRCQSISLTRLEEAQIDGFTGEDHEHDFLELIFRSSPMLNRVDLKLVPNFQGCTKKIYSTFLAYPAVKGYVYFSSAELVPPPSD